jgi:hypothetical protein
MNTRRSIPLTATALSALALLVASSGASAPAHDQTSAATSRGYNFKAEVTLQLIVDWREWSGWSSQPCSSWSSAAGRSRILMTGHVSGRIDFGRTRVSQVGDWATLAAVGDADRTESWSNRRLNEARGSTQCGETPAKTFPQPPNDCEKPGRTQKREIVGQLTLRPGRRRSLVTLREIVEGEAAGKVRVLVVDGAPLQGWYRNCRVSRLAPDVPVNMAFPVENDDVSALRTLKPNQTYTFGEGSGVVACARPNETGDTEKCSGEVALNVSFRRIRNRERFP